MSLMPPIPDRNQDLRRCVRDLVALTTLPAIWSHADSQAIGRSLAEVLLRLLSVDFIFVRLHRQDGGLPSEVVRTRYHAESQAHAHDIGQALAPWLESANLDQPPTIHSPVGDGFVRLAVVPIGHSHDHGVLAAGCTRLDFPTDTERLILSVAVNQAAGLLERKEAEDQLCRSEKELSDFFENASVGLHWVASDGTIVRVNQAELDLLGYTREEYVGHHIAEFHVDQDVIMDVLWRLSARQTIRDCEARMRCKDGSIKHVLIDSSVLWQEGRFIHTRCFTRDITDRRIAEDALRKQSQWLQVTLASIGDAVITTDANGYVTSLNEAAESLTSWRHAEAHGIPLQQVFHIVNEQTRQPVENPATRVLGEGKVVGLANHTILIARDGSERAIDDSATPIQDEHGCLLGVVLIFRDVTEKRAAERTLREREERYELVLAGSGAAIWDWDVPAGRIVFSPLWKHMRGYEDDEISDREEEWSNGIHPDDRERVFAAVQAHLDGKTPVFAEEYRIRHKSGRWIWIMDRGLARRDSLGRVIRMAGSETDITGRKEVEEALRESEQRFKNMADTAPAMLWITGPDASCTFLSRGWYEFTGQTPQEALGFGWLNAVHADDREQARDIFLEAYAKNVPFALDYRLRRTDGQYRWTIDAGRPRFGPDGTFLGYIGSVIDVHERKQAEVILRESEERFRSLADHAPVLIWLNGPTGCEFMNRSYIEFLGAKPEALQGMGWADFVHPDDRRDYVQAYQMAVQRRALFEREFRFRRVDGEFRYMKTVGVPRLSATGEFLGYVGCAYDIDDRKRAEKVLGKQNDLLRLMSEAAGVLLSAQYPDAMLRRLFGKIGGSLGLDVYFNLMINETGDGLRLASCAGIAEEAASSISRLNFGQAVCGRVAEHQKAIVATYIQDSSDPMVQLVKGHGIRAYACHPLLAGGRLLGTLSFASRTRDSFEQDEIEFFETITRYVAAAYERLGLIAELREHGRRKDEFLATLAHELRNPLAPIRNAAQILKMKAPPGSDLGWARDVIDRQVGHMARLLDDLLDISRITRAKLELRRSIIVLSDVVSRAVETSQPLIDSGAHELTISLPDEPVYLHADPIRLAQVFANLLNNAAKYTPNGGHIRFAASLERGNDGVSREVSISIMDTGIGIAPDMLPRVFEMFSQAEPALARSHGGLGIGLALTRGLVEMHGGSVEAHSAGEGCGSEFVVRLPVASSSEAVDAPRSVDTAFRGAPRCRVLVADDNEDSAKSLGLLLEMMGYEVRTARDGHEAIRLTSEFRPSVALLDIGMPNLNGYEIARLVRGEPCNNDLKLIALTGWGQHEDKRRAFEAGFNAHMTKPIDFDELQTVLGTLLADPPKSDVPAACRC